ncbi:MAG: glycoside hydrolase family 5 protein [bacterium]
MRTYLSVILPLLYMALVPASATWAGNDPIPWATFFHAEGRHLVADSNGARCFFRGVNLPGMEYGAFFEHSYPGTLGTDYFQPAADDLRQVAAWRLDCVRIPFEWGRLVPAWQPGDAVELDTSYHALLDEVIRRASEEQLYIVLDMHDFLKYWSGQNQQVFVDSQPAYQTLLADTWRLLAASFATNTAVLGYEIMNEPVRYDGPGTGSDSNWHAIAQAVVDAIRTVDTNHLILVDGRNYSLPGIWQRDNGTNAFVRDIVSPPRIAYCPHVYFDVDGDSKYEEGGAPVTNWYAYVRDRLLPVLDWAETNNVPLMITESGIPGTQAWAGLLNAVCEDFFDPLRLSFLYWLYDPRQSSSELQLATNGCVLGVLTSHVGSAYCDMEAARLTERHSILYGDQLRPPWLNASWLLEGDAIDFDAENPYVPGSRAIRVCFTNAWSGLKVYHDYLDIRRFAYLEFTIRGDPGGQDLLLFTEDLLGQAREDKKRLSDYVVPDTQNRLVRIPIGDIAPADGSVITAVVFQNLATPQPTFYLWDVRLLAPKVPARVSRVSVDSSTIELYFENLTPYYSNTVERADNLLDGCWTNACDFYAVGSTTNWSDVLRARGFYRLR